MKDNIITLKDDFCEHVAEYTNYPDKQHLIALYLELLDIKRPVIIKCRITEFKYLEFLSMLISALRKHDFHIEEIDFLYLFGMRSDRPFAIGQPNYFRDIVAPIINGFQIPRVLFMTPHSYLSLVAINNASSYHPGFDLHLGIHSVTIGGDQHTGLWNQAFFNKVRNENSIMITLTEENRENISSIMSTREGNALIIDDMCDAGGTFINGAKCFKEHFDRKLNLYVVHGLFTKGLEPLLEHFEHIYCTNSYQDIEHPRLTQFKVI